MREIVFEAFGECGQKFNESRSYLRSILGLLRLRHFFVVVALFCVTTVKKTKKNLAHQEISIEFSDSAMDLLADLGYDPQFGARPLKRVIQKEIINELSKSVLSGNYGIFRPKLWSL